MILVILLLIWGVSSTDNGLGLTPQMGWNSWNHYGCHINETLIKHTANLLVSTGLALKGYKFLNLDDCWQIDRDAETSAIIEDPKAFPSGMGNLSAYLHGMDLKFGLYSDAGAKTCEGRPGGLGYERWWMQESMRNGIDYLKYDNCYNESISGKDRYLAMHKALNESGRHIFYSMCNWGKEESWKWAAEYANSWRTTGDIRDSWESWTSILDQQVGLEKYAGRGGWNDPDMLEVGNGGMTDNQYQAHFVFWCILKAPLLIGCSLDNITQTTLALLGNEELIAINQDGLGVQASRLKREVYQDGMTEVWGGPLTNLAYVLVFFNRGDKTKNISISLSSEAHIKFRTYSLRDVINHKQLGLKTDDILQFQVASHSVRALRLGLFASSLTTE